MTALGPSDACTNACKSYKGADRCGGNYAISLYRLTGVQYDTGSGAFVCMLYECDRVGLDVFVCALRDHHLLSLLVC